MTEDTILAGTRKRRVPVARRGQSTRYHAGVEDPDYTPAQLEFMRALDRYKQTQHRPYPTVCEVLDVLLGLGYRKAE